MFVQQIPTKVIETLSCTILVLAINNQSEFEQITKAVANVRSSIELIIITESKDIKTLVTGNEWRFPFDTTLIHGDGMLFS